VTDFATKLTAITADGSARDDLVRVTVDGTGEIIKLNIEARAMRMPSDELAAAVQTAHRDAWAQARATVQQEAKQMTPDISGLSRMLESVGSDAQQRMSDFARMAEQIAARLDRQ
jgi:DNA-binding protein YbaB